MTSSSSQASGRQKKGQLDWWSIRTPKKERQSLMPGEWGV